MAAGGRQQINVLNTAVRKLAGRFGAKEPTAILEAASSLAKDGVCARCLLRLAGHNGMDDYALPAPSQSEIIAALTPHRARPDSSSSDLPGGTCTPLCPVCFGLLPAFFDGRQPSLEKSAGAEAAAAAAAAAAEAEAGAETGSTSGVDVAWMRLQQKTTFIGNEASRAGPLAGHERLPGLPSAASLAAAVQRQVTEGSPNTRALMAAAAAAATTAAAAAAGGNGDVAMPDAAPTSATAAAAPGASQPVLEALPADAQLGPPLPLKCFTLDFIPGPAASAVRDVAMYGWLVDSLTAAGMKTVGWRLTDIVPLPAVLRRLVPITLSRQLGVPLSHQPQQPGCVSVSVVVTDGEEGLEELRALAQFEASSRQGRRGPYNNQQPQQYQRFNKRQRGPHGKQQQQQQQQAEQEGEPRPGGDGGGADPAKGADARPRPSMSWDEAHQSASRLPPQVVKQLLPWPPLPLAKRTGGAERLQQAQPQPQPEAEQQQQPREEQGTAAATGAAAGEDTEVAAGGGGGPDADTDAAAAATALAAALPCVNLKAMHPPLLLAGRYCKLRRHMPQCPWFVVSTGERIGGTSVQEAIERFVLPLYGTAVGKMITGGREDADVRMLGPGRPFILELQAPVRDHPPAAEFRRTEQRMKDSKCGVSVQGLKPCGPSSLETIKAAEEAKEKTYRALCWAEVAPTAAELEALTGLGRVETHQDTPVRVLHRRAAKVRPKWLQVESATAVPEQPHYFVLQLRTQAGTYVKEFCHGDFGRCHPSLGDLLGRIQAKRAAGPTAPAEANGSAAGAPPADPAAAAAASAATAEAPAVAADDCGKGVGGATAAATAAAAKGSTSTDFVRTEIIQLDVMDVHLENWP